MKNIITMLLFVALAMNMARAQQEAQYTQYMYNTQVINPAYAGSRGVFSAAALFRSQWSGLDGAPTTQTLNISSPVSRSVGLGLSVINDQIGNGTNQNTYFDVAFSYTVPTSPTGKLSFGLKGGGHLLDINLNKLRGFNPLPGQLNNSVDIDKKFSPNIGAGVYYHTKRFYAGLSVPNFLKTEHFENSTNSSSFLVEQQMSLYLISGFVFDLNSDFKFKPSILFRSTNGAPLQTDISATFLFKEFLSLGAGYRFDASLSALAGFQLNDKFMLGLAYEKDTSRLGGVTFNSGSFEAFLRYELLSRHRKVLAPRFF